jgi:hypothetical protein
MEKSSMSIDYTQMQWWDRKVFMRSAAAFVAVLVGLLAWIEHVKMPEGYEFEKLPLLTGIYKCCEAGGRYSASWVGGTQVVCGSITYFGFIGRPNHDCGRKEQLNRQQVEVEQVLFPTLANGFQPEVSRITSNSNAYYEVSSSELRRRWLNNSRREAFSIAVILFIILYGAQMSFLKPSPKK